MIIYIAPLKFLPCCFWCLEEESPGGVLKILAKFTGKHLCQDLFFNIVAGFSDKDYDSGVFLLISRYD